MFQLFSLDASKEWIEITKNRFPEHLINRVHFQYSNVKIGKFSGQLCHYCDCIPDIVPDFIYLDGPSAKDVKGNINGLSFNCEERTVMSGDLLLMESTFLPGTFIVVDGRINNARFLERNFSRNYEIKWDRDNDISTFELLEERLGKYNLLGSDFFCCIEAAVNKVFYLVAIPLYSKAANEISYFKIIYYKLFFKYVYTTFLRILNVVMSKKRIKNNRTCYVDRINTICRMKNYTIINLYSDYQPLLYD